MIAINAIINVMIIPMSVTRKILNSLSMLIFRLLMEQFFYNFIMLTVDSNDFVSVFVFIKIRIKHQLAHIS